MTKNNKLPLKTMRRIFLTIENPKTYGYTPHKLKSMIKKMKSLIYGCYCYETGECGTEHVHIYLSLKNSIRFSTIQNHFPSAHIEKSEGNHDECIAYIQKDGKWSNTEKASTNQKKTFWEYGKRPEVKRRRKKKMRLSVLDLIRTGKSNLEIVQIYPSFISKMKALDEIRQEFLKEKYGHTNRHVECTYIYGDTRTGKTSDIIKKYGAENVYRITSYGLTAHPFDGYRGQDVLVFDEFRAGKNGENAMPFSNMLTYMEGYPLELPARYGNKVACYTKVIVISNDPLKNQYTSVDRSSQSWMAFLARFMSVQHYTNNGITEYGSATEYYEQTMNNKALIA